MVSGDRADREIAYDLGSAPLLSSLVFPCVLLTVPLLALFLFRSVKNNPLSSLPGPLLARITRWYRVYVVWRGQAPVLMAELHSTYGSIVRVGPQHVMISDPAAVDIIHGFGSGFVKSPMYDVLELPVSGSGVHMLVTTQDGARHRLLRSQVASLFTEQGMLAFEDAVDDCVREFIQALRSRAIAPLDLSDWFQYYAGDVAARTTLGEAVGFLSHGEDIDDMVANLARGFHYAAIVGQVPDWHPYLIGNRRIMPILTKYLGFPDPTKPFLERIKLATYAHTRGAQVMGPTVLSFLLGHPSYCGESRDESDLIGQCFAFLAGGNSVALTLGSVFYYLLRYPSAYNSLRQELNQVGGQEQPRCAVKDAEIKYLPYLDACIIEALRLCPTSQIALERVVPEGGVAFQKHFLPSGTRVSIAPQCIHLNTQIYGTDAAEYRPERWIEASKAQRQVMERYFFAFSKGTRACLCRRFAMMQVRKLLFQVLREFGLEWAANVPDWQLQHYWLTEQHGLQVRLLDCKRGK